MYLTSHAAATVLVLTASTPTPDWNSRPTSPACICSSWGGSAPVPTATWSRPATFWLGRRMPVWRPSPHGASCTDPTPPTPGWRFSSIDCHFGKTRPAAPVLPARPPQHEKRPRAESSTSYESGSESGQPIPALSSFRTSGRQPSLRGFTRGGIRGSGTGNPFPRGFKRGNFSGGRLCLCQALPYQYCKNVLSLKMLFFLAPNHWWCLVGRRLNKRRRRFNAKRY